MSQFQMMVFEVSPGKEDRFAEITKRMNERFRTVEQFEMQIDIICLSIAMDLHAVYVRYDDILVFNFTYLTYEEIVRIIEKKQMEQAA